LGLCAGIGLESETSRMLAHSLERQPQLDAGLSDADGCSRR